MQRARESEGFNSNQARAHIAEQNSPCTSEYDLCPLVTPRAIDQEYCQLPNAISGAASQCSAV